MCCLTGQLPRIDSMKEVLKQMRMRREKTSMHDRFNKANKKDSVVKLMATYVVDFITEEIGKANDVVQSSEAQIEQKGQEPGTCTSPPIVAAAMGNQQIRGQVTSQPA